MNNALLYSGISFVAGAVVGGLVAWKITEKVTEEKYSKLAQEEIDSVKEKFTVPKVEIEKKPEGKNADNLAKKATNKPTLAEYARKIKEYTNYSDADTKVVKKTKYVISPDEYGEDEKYDQVGLTFYADGILADDDDRILDADEVVGKESLNHIGDYEDDAVHVKNEETETYYEVLVDNRSYKDATGKDPSSDKDEED